MNNPAQPLKLDKDALVLRARGIAQILSGYAIGDMGDAPEHQDRVQAAADAIDDILTQALDAKALAVSKATAIR